MSASSSKQKQQQEDHENEEEEVQVKNKNKRHEKEKPWDTDDIDHWKIDPFTANDNTSGAFTEESSFAILFPKYREPYLRESWGAITKALDSVGIACTLDLVQGQMSVRTTRKTYDPYILLKARDLIKLLSRGVAAPQALKILQDDIACDVIKIGGLVRNRERFVKRRQRIVGPNGSTLKAIELLTECYVLVQGNTVSAMGGYKQLKEVRRIVVDCMNNIHPIYRIKELMIRRELAKDPKLAEQSWDRFLPKFQKRHLTTSQKTAKKNALAGPGPSAANATPIAGAEDLSEAQGPAKKKKKVYTPFPPPQQPSKLDLQLASGEYFLKPKEKEHIDRRKKLDQQQANTQVKRAQREEAFIAPAEKAAPTVEQKKKRKRTEAASSA